MRLHLQFSRRVEWQHLPLLVFHVVCLIVQETSGTTARHELSPTEVSNASNPSPVEPAEARVEMSPPRDELSTLSPAEPAVSPATTPQPCFDTAEEPDLPPESGESVSVCLMTASSCYMSLLFQFCLHFNFFSSRSENNNSRKEEVKEAFAQVAGFYHRRSYFRLWE